MSIEEHDFSDSPSANEAFYGKEMADAISKAKDCLGEIEKQHQVYFDSLTAEADEQLRPVKLHNFYSIGYDAHGIIFWVEPTLREDIAAECRACADSAFKR